MKFFRSPEVLKRKRPIFLKVELLEDRSLPSVTLGASFDGMSVNDTTCNCQPPDTIAAVGPNHVIEMVNTAIRIIDKTTHTTQSTTELSTFFSPVFLGPILDADSLVIHHLEELALDLETVVLEVVHRVNHCSSKQCG